VEERSVVLHPELVHKLFAVALLVVVLPALLHAMEVIHGRWPTHLIPAALLLVGGMLILDPVLFHGGDFGAEGFQHQVQGVALGGAGVVEWLRTSGKLRGRWFAVLLPLVVVGVGLLFVMHSQHGSGAGAACQLVQHRFLGATVIGAGLVKLAAASGRTRGNWADVGWLLLLVLTAVQLSLYSESLTSPANSTPAAHAHGGSAP
jgi:hypothetical protein